MFLQLKLEGLASRYNYVPVATESGTRLYWWCDNRKSEVGHKNFLLLQLHYSVSTLAVVDVDVELISMQDAPSISPLTGQASIFGEVQQNHQEFSLGW